MIVKSLVMQSAAIVALFSLGACASNGRANLAGGIAGGSAAANDNGAGASGAGGTGAGGSGAGASSGNESPIRPASVAAGTTERLITNTGGQLTGLTGAITASGLPQTIDGIVDPLARASIGNNTIIGAGSSGSSQQVGLSVLSSGQNQGQLATIGVLSNDQAASASLTPSTGGLLSAANDNGLLGVRVQNQQVIGGANDAIGIGVISPTNAGGSLAGANLLSGGQIANVQVNGAAPGIGPIGGLLNTVTGAVGN